MNKLEKKLKGEINMNENELIEIERFRGEIVNKQLLEKTLTRFGVKKAEEMVREIQQFVHHYSKILRVEKWVDKLESDYYICVEWMGANEKEENWFWWFKDFM